MPIRYAVLIHLNIGKSTYSTGTLLPAKEIVLGSCVKGYLTLAQNSIEVQLLETGIKNHGLH